MKNQTLFSSKDRSEKLKCRLLQFLFGALRVNTPEPEELTHIALSFHSVSRHLVIRRITVFLRL